MDKLRPQQLLSTSSLSALMPGICTNNNQSLLNRAFGHLKPIGVASRLSVLSGIR